MNQNRSVDAGAPAPFKAYLHLEMKIIRRYLHPGWMVVMLVGFIVVWYWADPDSRAAEYLNVPLLADFFLISILGMYFQDFFWAGPEEPYFRFVFPGDFRMTVRIKNLLILGVLLGSIIMVSGALMILFRPAFVQFVNGALYVFSAVFLLLHFGNMNTLRMRRKYRQTQGISMLIRNGLAFVGASLPYIILKVLMGSAFLCLLFTLLAVVGWYFYSVPRTAKLLAFYKFELLEVS